MRYLLHDVFTQTVSKYPDNIAIQEETGTSFTYTQLNQLSNQFAHYFSSKKPNIQTAPFVGVLSAVHAHSVASILGCLKIGAAYIPLDEYSPTRRLGSIIENTKLETVVVDPILFEQHRDLFDHELIKHVVLLYEDQNVKHPKIISFADVLTFQKSDPPLLNQVSDDLAYILHSSGSTGVPKGIMLTHRNARTFVDWMQKEFLLTPSDVVMSRAPFKFDLSVFDVFNTFLAGAKLICFDWRTKREEEVKHSSYVQLMEREKATILYTTPSTFILMINRGGLAESKSSLRTVMYAGEPFPTPQLRRLQQALPKTRIANIYGPTETNIITYWWVDTIPDDDSAIPLGYVVEDTEILVVSETNEICQPDEVGELWCRGGTVTIGYLGMEEKTAQSRVLSPFHKFPTYFWRTGDFGYRDKNDILHYRGRKDHMVKVKGFRIEIGEVEAALAKNADLDEFVVVAVPDEKYGNRLYCYYSIIKNPQKLVDAETIEVELMKYLPYYMIPFAFVKKDVLPKTSSGKVDRVLLLEEANELVV